MHSLYGHLAAQTSRIGAIDTSTAAPAPAGATAGPDFGVGKTYLDPNTNILTLGPDAVGTIGATWGQLGYQLASQGVGFQVYNIGGQAAAGQDAITLIQSMTTGAVGTGYVALVLKQATSAGYTNALIITNDPKVIIANAGGLDAPYALMFGKLPAALTTKTTASTTKAASMGTGMWIAALALVGIAAATMLGKKSAPKLAASAPGATQANPAYCHNCAEL